LVVDARLPLFLGGEPSVHDHPERPVGGDHERLAEVHHDAPPFAAAGDTIAIPRAAPEARAERATLSGMAPEDFAETLLKGPDFDRNEPLRSNTSQRSQVVDGHGHCVRNRRKSETVVKRPERIPPSPLVGDRRIAQAHLSRRDAATTPNLRGPSAVRGVEGRPQDRREGVGLPHESQVVGMRGVDRGLAVGAEQAVPWDVPEAANALGLEAQKGLA
jgi:hypothetical protein